MAYALLTGTCAVIYVIYFNVRLNARLRRFWSRPDTLAEWQCSFPSRSVRDITTFLQAVNDAFAFDREYVFRFRPDDRLFDVYSAVQPGMTPSGPERGWGDIERLDLLLRTSLGLSLKALWDCDRTLGTIFEHTGRTEVTTGDRQPMGLQQRADHGSRAGE
jgi:hypothetical protein